MTNNNSYYKPHQQHRLGNVINKLLVLKLAVLHSRSPCHIPEKGRDASTHALLMLEQLRLFCHVIGMPDEQLPEIVF